MLDPMQVVFDGAEAAQDALHRQEGCERALWMVLERVSFPDPGTEQMVGALIDSISHFRFAATAEVTRMQSVSMGQATP